MTAAVISAPLSWITPLAYAIYCGGPIDIHAITLWSWPALPSSSPTATPHRAPRGAGSAPLSLPLRPAAWAYAATAAAQPATKMLTNRARRRIQQDGTVADSSTPRQRAVVQAFLAASRNGDFDALLALLDPDVAFRADRTARQAGAPADLDGAAAVAGQFCGRARGARLALINGAAEREQALADRAWLRSRFGMAQD